MIFLTKASYMVGSADSRSKGGARAKPTAGHPQRGERSPSVTRRGEGGKNSLLLIHQRGKKKRKRFSLSKLRQLSFRALTEGRRRVDVVSRKKKKKWRRGPCSPGENGVAFSIRGSEREGRGRKPLAYKERGKGGDVPHRTKEGDCLLFERGRRRRGEKTLTFHRNFCRLRKVLHSSLRPCEREGEGGGKPAAF